MNIIEKYRKELIILGVIIEIILVPIIVRNLISLKNKNSNDNSIPSFNEIGKQEFGIMYRDSDTDQYKAYSGSIIDAINNKYVLNVNNSKCSDGANANVTPSSVLSISGSTVTIKSNKTVYCTLYFDLKKGSIDYLRKKDNQGYLSEDLQGGMYRYQAAPADADEAAKMTNWICFGTTENCGANDELIDKYMYRIIGITPEGEMKLIKETFIIENTSDGNYEKSFYWNATSGTSKYPSCPYWICPAWGESLLFNRLNGFCNGSTQGRGTQITENNSDIFVDNEYYDYLKSGDGKNGGTSASMWYKLITEHQWLYGHDASKDKLDANEVYLRESGNKEVNYYTVDQPSSTTIVQKTNFWTEKVTAKIGLMYVHDILYSYYDGVNENTRGVLGSESDLGNAWMHYEKDGYNLYDSKTFTQTECTMVSRGISSEKISTKPSYHFWYVTTIGDSAFLNTKMSDPYCGSRPVFYISSSSSIKAGDGTKTNPFILDVK